GAGAYSCTAPGPQPLGCIKARTTLVSKTDSAFGDKAASWKANALENIDALSLRTLMQPEGCGPGAVSLLRVQIGAMSECAQKKGSGRFRSAKRRTTDQVVDTTGRSAVAPAAASCRALVL